MAILVTYRRAIWRHCDRAGYKLLLGSLGYTCGNKPRELCAPHAGSRDRLYAESRIQAIVGSRLGTVRGSLLGPQLCSGN